MFCGQGGTWVGLRGDWNPLEPQNGGGKLEKYKKAQEEEDLCFVWKVGLPDHGVTE